MPMGTCRGCGKSILWAKDAVTQKAVPLDTTPPVYLVTQTPENNFHLARANQKFNTGEPMFFVSHFATCPKASDFSRNRKPVEAAPAAAPDVVDQKAQASGEGAR